MELALNVVHVHECGFLGVAPTIIYLPVRQEVTTIDGVGVWAKAASLDYFLQVHHGILPPEILRTITPGAADAWFMALGRYGTMSFVDVAGAAIELAGKGFPMHRYLAQQLRETQDRFEGWSTTAEVLMPGGRLPQVGEMFYQKDLASTLAQIAGVEEASRSRGREGALMAARDFVYKGELAERIASFCQAEGGTLTLDDIAASGARWEPPVTVNYRGLDVYACGPWPQGPVFPQALKTLEGFDLGSMGHNSDDYIHYTHPDPRPVLRRPGALCRRPRFRGRAHGRDALGGLPAAEARTDRPGSRLARDAPAWRPLQLQGYSGWRGGAPVSLGGCCEGWERGGRHRLLRRRGRGGERVFLHSQRGYQKRRIHNTRNGYGT